MPKIANAALAAGLLVTVAGCGADEAVVTVDDRGTVSVAEGARVPGTESGAVAVALGVKVVVDLGYQNSSVGDGWFLVGQPDPAVLADGGEHYESECDQPGCGGDMTWRFGTVGAGRTTITFRYCYRSRPPDCGPMPDRGPVEPVTLTVTVRPRRADAGHDRQSGRSQQPPGRGIGEPREGEPET